MPLTTAPTHPLPERCGHARVVWYWRALRWLAQAGASPALLAWALRQGYPYVRPLADGRLVGVLRTADESSPVGLRAGRSTTSVPNGHAPPGRAQHSVWVGSRELIADLWLYPDLPSALQAARTWDGLTPEPRGWHVHPLSGRRRPDGDPAREYVPPF
jgi:hypothetical protein